MASSKRFFIFRIGPCASKSSVVTFGCCSARALPVSIAAGSFVGCSLRIVASVLLSLGAAGGEIKMPAALVMPPLSCTSLLADIRQASGVPSRPFYRLLPTNTTSQSMRSAGFSLVYSF